MSEAIHKLESQILQREKYGQAEQDEEAILEELLDGEDEFLVHYREKRVQELSDHFKTVEKKVLQEGYGSLHSIDNESVLIKTAANNASTVVHFGLDTFKKCRYMNEKWELLAESHLTTKFVKIDVNNCPFLVSKLGIKVLPFVVAYRHGKETIRIVGFSKLGNDPNEFELESLEKLLSQVGVLGSEKRETIGVEDEAIDLEL
ncbi:PLP1 (YDR183W) [Zygosaccharomyces parabailii]|nr:PLP1 (YDR183W) [Zygosaccharomyces parabailii]